MESNILAEVVKGKGIIQDIPVDWIAIIISIISIVLSAYAIYENKKMNKTNLQSKYYDEIFTEYLIKRIPESLRKVKFINGRLSKEYRQVNNTMMSMVEESLYFKFTNPIFYEALEQKTIALDEKLVSYSSKNIPDRVEQKDFILSVYRDVQDIVELINMNYFGN